MQKLSLRDTSSGREKQSGELGMCLAIPMQIKTIEGFNARCEAKGIERDVSLFMMQHDQLKEGDHVMVHVGYAIEKVTPQEAETSWQYYDEILETLDEKQTTLGTVKTDA